MTAGPAGTPIVPAEIRCAGFQGTTLIDFPDRVAAIVFVPGCNLRCPYCHNGALFEVADEDLMPPEALWEEIERRRDFIEGVVITGGEPSLHPELGAFARALRERGREVKLDTNGLDPAFVRTMLPFLSCVAVDLKTTPERYHLLGTRAGACDLRERLRATKEILSAAQCAVEYRVTMYPGVVDGVETLEAMMALVPANAIVYLQQFVPNHAWSDEAQKTPPFSAAVIREMAGELRRRTGRDGIYVRDYS